MATYTPEELVARLKKSGTRFYTVHITPGENGDPDTLNFITGFEGCGASAKVGGGNPGYGGAVVGDDGTGLVATPADAEFYDYGTSPRPVPPLPEEDEEEEEDEEAGGEGEGEGGDGV